MIITPRVAGWSYEYQQEVERFVSSVAVRFIGKYPENFPYQTMTVGENWLHVTSLTYDEKRKSEINRNKLVDKIIYVSTRYSQLTNELITSERMLTYINNVFRYDNFAMIPLTDSRNKEVRKLGSLENETSDFYRIKCNDRIITVFPEVKSASSLSKNNGVYVFINPNNVSEKIH